MVFTAKASLPDAEYTIAIDLSSPQVPPSLLYPAQSPHSETTWRVFLCSFYYA